MRRLDLDVLVVGGGPAGSACAAILAQRGARVAVVDSSDFNDFRVGETIDAAAGPLLARLGVSLDDSSWARSCHGVMALWGDDVPVMRSSVGDSHRHGWRVDRRQLDDAVFRRSAALGVTVWRKATVANDGRADGRWSFTIRTTDVQVQGSAALVIEATGRRGRSSFASGASRVWFDRLVGIVIRKASHGDPRISPDVALVEAVPDGWWYSVVVPDRTTLAIFFTDGDLIPRSSKALPGFLLEQLRRSSLINERWGASSAGATRDEPIPFRTFSARSGVRRTAVADGWIAVGDALVSFDPLTGRGVTAALQNGLEVGEAVASGDANIPLPDWIVRSQSRIRCYQLESAAVYSRETRWRSSAFWQRRQHEGVAA
jgi:flavin-dependent dehydrogenase